MSHAPTKSGTTNTPPPRSGVLSMGANRRPGSGLVKAATPTPAAAMPSALPPPPASKPKTAVRTNANPPRVQLADPTARTPTTRPAVVAWSRKGLSLLAARPATPGSRYRVRSEAYAEVAPWIDVEVVSCSPVEECWQIVCRFTTEPRWETLLQFG